MTPMSVVRGALNVDHEYTDPMLSWTRKDAGTAFQRLKSVGASDPSLLSQCRKPRAVAATGVTSSLLPLSSSRTAAPKRTENTHTHAHTNTHTHTQHSGSNKRRVRPMVVSNEVNTWWHQRCWNSWKLRPDLETKTEELFSHRTRSQRAGCAERRDQTTHVSGGAFGINTVNTLKRKNTSQKTHRKK